MRATLESVCYQTFDLLDAKRKDGVQARQLRVDGGMVDNDWLCGFRADIINIRVERPVITETTALGAAFLAGLQVGLFESLDAISKSWKIDQVFEPKMEFGERQSLLAHWHDAVNKVRTAT